jgi:tetratricopeptide (TPR) repeat protein
MPSADKIFNEAQREYEKGNIKKADELFLYAKELDALRFRAPERINDIIRNLSKKYNIALADIDSVFKSISNDGLVGYNLTVDHLHPNIEGYGVIEKSFFQKMEETNLLPDENRININIEKQDSILNDEFPFTRLDSVIAYMKIIQLTGEYPFVPKGEPNRLIQNFKFRDFIDSTALRVINNDIFWEEGHGNVAKWYYDKGDYKNFLKEMDALIAERPFFDIPYERTINLLIEAKLFAEAVPYLKKLNSLKPSYFTAKWLGQIAVENKNYKEAQEYLIKAVSYSNADYQVWYNLSGAYFFNNEYNKSLAAVEKSLQLNPGNPLAQNLYRQLKNLNR